MYRSSPLWSVITLCRVAFLLVARCRPPPARKVPNGAKTAFFWPEAGSGGWFGGSPGRRRLVARVSNAGWRWSGEFSPDSTVDVTLRLRKPRSRGVAYVRVKALLKGASVYLVSTGIARSLCSSWCTVVTIMRNVDLSTFCIDFVCYQSKIHFFYYFLDHCSRGPEYSPYVCDGTNPRSRTEFTRE